MTKAAHPRQKAPVVRISAEAVPKQAFADLLDGARLHELWTHLAFHDIRQRFRRSVLGPFWLTLSMGIFVAALGLVFSSLFQQDVAKTLPYIATGVIFWGLLTGSIIEGTTVFISAEAFIRNVPTPLSLHFYRMMTRNVMIWGFNMAIYLVVLIYFELLPGWNILLFIPGFFLFLINVAWMSLAAGVLSTRYRDIPQIIANLIQVVFFLTPVLAFAVSTAAQKDILLIDEGIGAGDAAFRKKAQQRIESLFDRTPIVILASHSESLISEFCSRRVLMQHGVLQCAS
jgi:ABC-type polysaccharide/polyol phosphate export permease